MRKLELVWNQELMQYEQKFVHHEENIPTKNKRYRGKNKISNFQDKVRAKRSTVWTTSQQANLMHAMRQCHSTETRILYLERTGQLHTV